MAAFINPYDITFVKFYTFLVTIRQKVHCKAMESFFNEMITMF